MADKEYVTQEQANFLTKRYQEAIASFDSIKSDLDSIKSKQVDNDGKFETNSFNLKFIKDEAEKNIKAMSGSIASLDSKVNGILKLMTDISAAISSIEGRLSGLSKLQAAQDLAIDKIDHKHEQLKQESIQHSHLRDVKSILIDKDLIAQNKFNESQSKHSASDLAIKNLQKALLDVTIQSNQHNATLSQLSSDLAQAKSSSSGLNNRINSQDESLRAYAKSLVPDLSDYAKNSDIKPAADNTKIESAALDAQNANLRCTNNTNQIDLLNKKIENLSLLIKQLQIGKS